VRRDGAVQALFREDLVRGLGGGHGLGGGVSFDYGSSGQRLKGVSRTHAIYLRCVVKAVPMAIAAGAANLLAGVWAATARLCQLELHALLVRMQWVTYAAAGTAVRFSAPT